MVGVFGGLLLEANPVLFSERGSCKLLPLPPSCRSNLGGSPVPCSDNERVRMDREPLSTALDPQGQTIRSALSGQRFDIPFSRPTSPTSSARVERIWRRKWPRQLCLSLQPSQLSALSVIVVAHPALRRRSCMAISSPRLVGQCFYVQQGGGVCLQLSL